MRTLGCFVYISGVLAFDVSQMTNKELFELFNILTQQLLVLTSEYQNKFGVEFHQRERQALDISAP